MVSWILKCTGVLSESLTPKNFTLPKNDLTPCQEHNNTVCVKNTKMLCTTLVRAAGRERTTELLRETIHFTTSDYGHPLHRLGNARHRGNLFKRSSLPPHYSTAKGQKLSREFKSIPDWPNQNFSARHQITLWRTSCSIGKVGWETKANIETLCECIFPQHRKQTGE